MEYNILADIDYVEKLKELDQKYKRKSTRSFWSRYRKYTQGFYSSFLWRSKRLDILARDHYLCKCGTIAKYVHHIVPIFYNINLILEDTNLISICLPCHKKVHKLK